MNDISLLAIMQKLAGSGGGGGGGGQSDLPSVTDADNGKILKVVEGEWNKGNEKTELPNVSSIDNGKVLKVTNGVWSKGNINVNVNTMSFIHLYAEVELPQNLNEGDQFIYTGNSLSYIIYSSNGEIIAEVENATADNIYDLFTHNDYKNIPKIISINANNGVKSSYYSQSIINLYPFGTDGNIPGAISKNNIIQLLKYMEQPAFTTFATGESFYGLEEIYYIDRVEDPPHYHSYIPLCHVTNIVFTLEVGDTLGYYVEFIAKPNETYYNPK